MPEEGIDFSKREDLLSYEEMVRLATIFSELGVTKVRLTGGEPFVRKDISKLLGSLRPLFSSFHITTNASLLHHHFDELADLNISSLNISLDSLDRNAFLMITRRDNFLEVEANILECVRLGIPVKINMVVMKGVNDHEMADFIRYGMKHKIEVRFIEAMPFNEDDGNKTVYYDAQVMASTLRNHFSSVDQLPGLKGSSSLTYLVDGHYRCGIIPSYSRSLCGTCNRIRLTPKGELLTCLYAQQGVDLMAAVRDNSMGNDDLKKIIRATILKKKMDGHAEEAERSDEVFRSMTTIGG